MYDEKELWNRILKTASQLNFYILLEHIFKVLEILKNNNIPSSLKHEKFLYKGISIIIPVEIYFVLCSIRFRQTFIEDEKYYFANCAIRAYNKHNKILSKYSVDEFEDYKVKNYRAKYETLYGEEISQQMKSNLKQKMSSIDRNIIDKRNLSIQQGMLDYWRHQKTN